MIMKIIVIVIIMVIIIIIIIIIILASGCRTRWRKKCKGIKGVGGTEALV
jgi:hypothetical protein